MSFAHRNASVNEFDSSGDDQECYVNARDAAVLRRANTLPSRAEVDDNNDEFEDSGEYEMISDTDAMLIAAASHRPPMASTSSSARGSASSFHRTSSASLTPGNSATPEDNEDANSPANNFKRDRRMSSGGGREVVSGAGVRRNNSSGGGVAFDDGLNTAKITRIKSNLRPTAKKVFDKPSNTEESGAGILRAPALRPVKAGAASTPSTPSNPCACACENRSQENNSRPVKVVRSLSNSEVGSGLNSVKIRDHISQLRPTLPKNDNNNNTEITNINSEPSVRDAQRTASASPKDPPICPAAKKNPTSSGTQPPQPRHQATRSPPAFPSSPPRCPIPPPPNCSRNEPCTNPKQRCPKGDQPWSSGSGSVGLSEPPVKASASRSQVQQPIQVAKTGHALASKLPTGLSASVAPFVDTINDDTHGRVGLFQEKRILDNYKNNSGRKNGRIDADFTAWEGPNSSLSSQNWYFGNLERDLCELKLDRLINEDGSYLVRDSQRGGEENPYTLSIVFKKHIYHLSIRLRPDGRFSIGKSKPDEKVFNNVVEMVTFHQNNFIELIGDSQRKMPPGKVTLKKCPTKC